MPKIIAPKRTNKLVTVQDYWAIRQKFSKNKQKTIPVYKESEVEKRHRFSRLRDQIKTFNPLDYFIAKAQDFSTQHKTHTHAYLQSIAYRLPQQIMQVKKMMFGLASILKNIEKIYQILWDHLNTVDAWRLVQALLKDTRDQSYDIWLNKGLKKMVENISKQFKQTKFKQIFHTLCILMEVSFTKISKDEHSLFQFFSKLSELYFESSNKYIRKFSVKACSYVLSNIDQQLFQKFIILIVAHTNNNNYKLLPFASDILAQRLKYSDGSLTPNSLQQLIQLITWVGQINNIDEVLSKFTHRVLANLQQKNRYEQNQTLFDLKYVVKAFIHMGQQNKMKRQCIIEGLVFYLEQSIKQKHEKKRKFNQDTLKTISEFLWESLPVLTANQKVYHLLALSFSNQLENIGNIKNFLYAQSNQQLVLQFLELLPENIKKDTVMLLIASLVKHIQQFITNPINQLTQTKIYLIYKLFLLTKNYQIVLNTNKMFTNIVNIKQQIDKIVMLYKQNSTNIEKQKLYQYTLVFLRILSIFQLNYDVKKSLNNLMNLCLKDYYAALQSCFVKNKRKVNSIFSCGNYTEEIFLYAHTTIPLVWQGFNLIQSFIQIEKLMKQFFIDRNNNNYNTWQKISINRPSIHSQTSQILQKNTQYYIYALQSRHRMIRHFTLQYLRSLKISQQHETVLEMLEQVDYDQVDLQNQRNIKRVFSDLLRYVQNYQLEQRLNKLIISWCLGFAFTGFKLIQQAFTNFLAGFLQVQNQLDLTILFKFIEYYTFRNSRVYEQQIKYFFDSANTSQNIQLSSNFIQLANKDFQNNQLQTVEFIGMDRVSLSISKSQKVKQKLGDKLLNILKQYFNQQFIRFKTTLLNNSQNAQFILQAKQNTLLLPPKSTYLNQILKLCPSSYLPPIQCIHFTSSYLKLESVKKIKRQQWQLLWNKTTKMDHTRIRFQSMSQKQMQLYIHFLFGQLLKADANKLRIIVEYIRDYMNHKVQYFMNVYYKEVLLGIQDEDKIKVLFQIMDSRKLLTYIYILKAVVKGLKNYVRIHYDKILKFLMNMIQVLDVPAKKIQNQMEEQNKDEQNQQQQLEDQQQQPQQQQHTQAAHKKFKNHRKQIYKILTSLISLLAQQLPIQQINQILTIFKNQNKIQSLGKISLHSTPGLLLVIRQLARCTRFHKLLAEYQIFQQIQIIIKNGPIAVSISVGLQIIGDLLGITKRGQQQKMIDQNWISVIDTKIAQNLLGSILQWVQSVNKVRADLQYYLLQILLSLYKKSTDISQNWQKYLLLSLTRILSAKTITQINNQKLALYIQISMEYCAKSKSNKFLLSLLPLIPQLRDIQHRKLVVAAISSSLTQNQQHQTAQLKQIIGQQAVKIVAGLNSTIDGGLVVQIDYPAFFDSVNKYKQIYASLTLIQHEFIIYNILAYLVSPQLSVRKSVNSCLQIFLNHIKQNNRDLVAKIFRIIGQQSKKPMNGQETIFWSIFACVGHFIRWIILNDQQNAGQYVLLKKHISLNGDGNNDVFEMLCAIAQNKKLDGLKVFKQVIKQEFPPQNIYNKYPNIIQTIFLPVLQHFILPPVLTSKDFYRVDIVGNLTSSLSHVSLQIYEQVMKKGGESLQKKQLKKLISKIKFDDNHIKKNIILIKMISQIVESIDLPKITQIIRKIVAEQGFQDFHKKILEKQSKTSKIKQDQEDSQEEEEMRKRIAFNGINNQIDDQQIINIGYLTLDKKLLQAQQAQNKQNKASQQNSIIKFLRINVLMPLKTMLMFQNRSQKNSKQQSDKSRMFLSIAVTKIILKFPTDIFVNELSRILSKLGKLLKKKQLQIRQNSRKCLAEIAKLVGPDMFYLIFRQLKFHLRDNFQHHILNYTIYYILQKYGNLQNGSIDHCLPLLLPPIIDQIYGKSANQKQMVDQNLIPTINMQSKKRKSNDLLAIICKQISIKKIDYLVKYFQKFLLEFMNSEANVTKYQQMLTNIIGGLGKNQQLMQVSNSSAFIQVLHQSIQKLKHQIKLYKFDQIEVKHESTIKQNHAIGKKAGKQVLQIQQQAGRNASIFKKQAKQIQQKRNHQILVGCFMQFHLAVLALLIKKKIINSEEHSQKFQSIITFIVQCIEHRDNRLVHKCLKVIHNVIHWKKLQNIMQIRKKASRKIFGLIEKLTSADQDLLRECFTLLNDLFEQVSITSEVLHILITIIKLHITTVQQTIAEQPYKLLKTVLIKISNDPHLFFDQALIQLYQYVRATLISTTLDHIRNVCRQICCIYIRQQQPIIVSNDHKKKNKVAIDYSKQISFYINNLDCKYSQTQSSVLDVIKTYITYHTKQQIQQTGQVIIMTLGTTYANDADNQHKISQIIKIIVQKIDNSKVIGLIDKSISWSNNQQNQLVSVCGFYLLYNIILVKGNLLNTNRKTQISNLCTKILQKQVDKVQLYDQDIKQKINQNKTLRQNPQWQNIIQHEEVYLSTQKNIKLTVNILNYLFDNFRIIDSNQVRMLWRLITANSTQIHSLAGSILVKVDSIVGNVGEGVLSIGIQQQNSVKNKIVKMVKNTNETQGMPYASQIVKKVLQQIKTSQNIIQIIQSIILILLNRISKSILNLKKNQKSMQQSYNMLQVILSNDKDITQKIMKNQKMLGQILWIIAKVNRNELIVIQIKTKNQQFSEIIKNMIGQADFYRRLANAQADRKNKKAIDKAQLLKLAITDQQAYGIAKARKKHKKQ